MIEYEDLPWAQLRRGKASRVTYSRQGSGRAGTPRPTNNPRQTFRFVRFVRQEIVQ